MSKLKACFAAIFSDHTRGRGGTQRLPVCHCLRRSCDARIRIVSPSRPRCLSSLAFQNSPQPAGTVLNAVDRRISGLVAVGVDSCSWRRCLTTDVCRHLWFSSSADTSTFPLSSPLIAALFCVIIRNCAVGWVLPRIPHTAEVWREPVKMESGPSAAAGVCEFCCDRESISADPDVLGPEC